MRVCPARCCEIFSSLAKDSRMIDEQFREIDKELPNYEAGIHDIDGESCVRSNAERRNVELNEAAFRDRSQAEFAHGRAAGTRVS